MDRTTAEGWKKKFNLRLEYMDPVAPEGRTTLVILNYLSQSIPISDLAI